MAGIYVHVPFCKSRCRYCDFFSTTCLDRREAYVEAVAREYRRRKCYLNDAEVRTIYLGGGTPSMLTDAQLSLLMQMLRADHPQVVESTLEANPGDISEERAKRWRDMGFNRLSIGIQSFHDELLQRIGRRHTASEARMAVRAAQRAGFENISIDLMYGLPGQTMADWQQDIEEALRLDVQHISAYNLIYEEGTRLTEMRDRGEVTPVDEDLEIDMHNYLIDRLLRGEFVQYEVSNFSQQGLYSQHNSSYWNHTPYLGLGAGAHSFDGTSREWNVADLEAYIAGAEPTIEKLTEEDLYTEDVMLRLRTSKGLPMAVVPDVYKACIRRYAADLIRDGYLHEANNSLIVTRKGQAILNRIIEKLLYD